MAPISIGSAVLRAVGRVVEERRDVLMAHASMLEDAAAEGRSPASTGVQLDLVVSEIAALRDMLTEVLAAAEIAARPAAAT